MWFGVTLAHSNKTAYVNANRIAYVYNDTRGYCNICFGHDDEEDLMVTESIDEVMKRIEDCGFWND